MGTRGERGYGEEMRDWSLVPAFCYDDDRLVRCENHGERMRVLPPAPPMPLSLAPSSRRERRWLARHGSGRRRMNARRIQPPQPIPRYALWAEPITFDGHRISGWRHDALLYLPVGERVTDRHMADLDRLLSRPPDFSLREQYQIANESDDREAAALLRERLALL
jgi:hypothetical protein